MTATRPARAPASSRAPAASPSATSPGTTTLDPVIAKLSSLGLEYPAAVLPELVEQAARDALSPLAFLDLLLSCQLERKDERRVTTMLKLSGLPPGKTLEDFWSACFERTASQGGVGIVAHRGVRILRGPRNESRCLLTAAFGMGACSATELRYGMQRIGRPS